jgi:prepilin-type N-terminal cleavage/methylation domain-containing protein
MTRKASSAAFTLIEMLVVISIIVVLASFAVPAVISGLTKGQMVGTLNNARQLFLAGQQMALDGSTNGDTNLAWPGDYAAGTINNLQDYCNKLVQGDYLKGADLPKLLSAPGATCTATTTTANNVTTVTLSGTKSALKVYPVSDKNNSNTIFATTSNYVYDTAFGQNPPNPYGDKGFVVIRKGGDASVLKKNNAQAGAGATGISAFESQVGKKPGEADGAVTAGDPNPVLTYP